MKTAKANLLLGLLLGLVLLPTLVSSPLPTGTDVYYHIRFARMVAEGGFPDEFPWVTQSVLGDSFADTAPLFHLLLVPFTAVPEAWGGLLAGAKLEAYLAALGLFLLFGAFLRRRGLPHPWLWTLLFVAVGGGLWRYSMARPHTISVMMMIGFGWALGGERRRWLVGGIAAVWWSAYVGAPQLALGMVLVDLLVRWRREGQPSAVPLVATAVGLGVAALLHPNFPRSLSVFWTQTVEIPLADWIEGEAVRRPTEMEPYSLGLLVVNTFVVWLAVGAIAALARRRRRPWSREAATFAILAAGATPLFLLSQRFVEYWAPLALLACALRFADLHRAPTAASGASGPAAESPRPGGLLAAAALLLALVSSVGVGVSIARQPPIEPDREAAEWLAANTPEDSIVFTANWSDFPRLWFFNRHNRYLVHMDPIFMRKHDRAAWDAWNAIRFGRVPSPSRRIEEVFNAGAVFVTDEFPELHERARADLGLKSVLPNLYLRR